MIFLFTLIHLFNPITVPVMKLANNTMWSLLVGLALVWISGTDSQSFTERQLTPESAALVQSFRTYLSSVERNKRNEIERIGRGKAKIKLIR